MTVGPETEIIVRDANTGAPVRVNVRKSFPDWMIPETIFDNAYWVYSQTIGRNEVMRFLGKDLQTLEELRRFCLYFETYAKHIVMAVYLFNPDRTTYAESQRHYIERLTELRKTAFEETRLGWLRKIADEMLRVCIDNAVDPL